MNHKAYQTARFTPVFALAAVALGLGSASCTGDDSANHVLSQAVVPDEVLLFDDFEGVAPTAPPIKSWIVPGQGWYKYDDHTLDLPDGGPPDAAVPPGQQVVATETLPEPHVTIHGPSATALHIYGGSFKDWGAGVGGSNLNGGAPYDLSAYTGIIFWAKMGQATTSNSLTVAIGTLNDAPNIEGGVCHDPETPGKHDRCQDSFHLDITLRQDWKLYIIAFSDLVQAGWGYKPLGGFDPKVATGIAFSNKGVTSKGGQPFDEWIDDIAFFK